MQYIDYCPRPNQRDQDIDNIITSFFDEINAGLSALGVDSQLSAKGEMLQMVKEAGFQKAEERTWMIPIGQWPKEKHFKVLGAACQVLLSDAAAYLARTPLVRGLGKTEAYVQERVTEFRQGLNSQRLLQECPLVLPFRVVYGQKPDF